jgi:hypothetical protein
MEVTIELYLQGIDPGTHWIGSWVDLSRSGRNDEEKHVIIVTCRNPTLVVQPVNYFALTSQFILRQML